VMQVTHAKGGAHTMYLHDSEWHGLEIKREATPNP